MSCNFLELTGYMSHTHTKFCENNKEERGKQKGLKLRIRKRGGDLLCDGCLKKRQQLVL
jgi:hypothetical protein